MEKKDYPQIDYVMEKEGLHKVCKYQTSAGSNVEENPHCKEKRDFALKIKNDITDVIGNTPLVRINNITKKDGIKCELRKRHSFTFSSRQMRIPESRRLSERQNRSQNGGRRCEIRQD